MTTYRSQLIREVETDLQNSRARSMMKQPKFAGQTYTEVKAERARHRRLTLRWAGWATFVLIMFAFAVHLVTR